jgi:hypothetical protein
MTDYVEQRRSERFACESPLMCSSLGGQAVYSARTVDHGARGLSFITQTPLQSGTTIFFRADTFAQKRFSGTTCKGMRGTGLARIRWCRSLEDQSPAAFRVGVEYLDPYP